MADNRKKTGSGRKTAASGQRRGSSGNGKRSSVSTGTVQKNAGLETQLIQLGILLVLVLITLCIFLHTKMGVLGRTIYGLTTGLLGFTAYLYSLLGLVTMILYMAKVWNRQIRNKILTIAGSFFLIAVFLQILHGTAAGGSISKLYKAGSYRNGGLIGGLPGYWLARLLGKAGSIVLVVGLFLILMIFLSEGALLRLAGRGAGRAARSARTHSEEAKIRRMERRAAAEEEARRAQEAFEEEKRRAEALKAQEEKRAAKAKNNAVKKDLSRQSEADMETVEETDSIQKAEEEGRLLIPIDASDDVYLRKRRAQLQEQLQKEAANGQMTINLDLPAEPDYKEQNQRPEQKKTAAVEEPDEVPELMINMPETSYEAQDETTEEPVDEAYSESFDEMLGEELREKLREPEDTEEVFEEPEAEEPQAVGLQYEEEPEEPIEVPVEVPEKRSAVADMEWPEEHTYYAPGSSELDHLMEDPESEDPYDDYGMDDTEFDDVPFSEEALIRPIHERPARTSVPRRTNEERKVERQPVPVGKMVPSELKPVFKGTQEELSVPYTKPDIELLTPGTGDPSGESREELAMNAKRLEEALGSFGVKARVTQVNKGPAVTRYELQPAIGVKVSRIVNLADDIALALAARDVRIEAPIPGKSAVGIEIPNKEAAAVMLRDVIDTDRFRRYPESGIAFALGKDIDGTVQVADITKMPHLLIAGATGSGKSVCINTLLISILYKCDPKDVKLILIDPKVVELSVYNGIPHLMTPVVNDPRKAATTLKWAVQEMTSRYQKFSDQNVRDIRGYNEKVKLYPELELVYLPKIVIVIDELADLMMVSSKEVEDSICRLAQMARAAGIHLVIATQRPSVDIITGLIKANIPSRLAFAVSSGVDSRTILDMVGAEKLLGKGDMLFAPLGTNKPVRIQGAFVSDHEVESIVEAVRDPMVKADESLSNAMNDTGIGGGAFDSDEDEYLAEAVKFVVEKQKASISMLQRVFRIGFNRAARLMDALEDRGVVGPDEGSKPRKVLMSREEYNGGDGF